MTFTCGVAVDTSFLLTVRFPAKLMPAPNLYTVHAVVDLIYSLRCMFTFPNINHVLQKILSEISNASIAGVPGEKP